MKTAAPRSATRLTFWGVRGSIPTPGPYTVQYGGNTSCIEFRAEGQIIILDAGSGLRPLGRALSTEFSDKPFQMTLLLSHTHWDHIQGLPFFLPAYSPRNRLRILGYEGARHGLGLVLSNQMESPVFPVDLRQLPVHLTIEELTEFEFNIGRVQVRACPADHPGLCVGYRLTSKDGSIAFFPDNELRLPATDQEGVEPQAPPQRSPAARPGPGELLEFLQGVDVLIMDSQYDSEEYQTHEGWGHGCLDRVVALAQKAGVRHLYLFHHDPDHDDDKITSMVERARALAASNGGQLVINAAREGLSVSLPLQ